jgi:hypothetical protein
VSRLVSRLGDPTDVSSMVVDGCVRTSCTVSRRPRGAARAADSDGSAGLPPAWPLTPVGWRERQRPGPQKPGEVSGARGGFDTGTPRGGSIGLMRAT